ncbi:hypothetical protein FB45DRAFT_67261 [Roridomyces roridus]|uniref:F-box domain-containing protein n=1 Tax=Roridomyces roridus TaxID=1738132 RepID=A0AAD7BN14_9AGAR|nr:hypothetical protein FB45DRAFT_67261 [Roridomyces roridus]
MIGLGKLPQSCLGLYNLAKVPAVVLSLPSSLYRSFAETMSSTHNARGHDNISNIPPELLGRIFQLAQPSDPEPDEDEYGDPPPSGRPVGNPVEVVASHVSVYWRNVALGLGALWRDIIIQKDETAGKVSCLPGAVRAMPSSTFGLIFGVRGRRAP